MSRKQFRQLKTTFKKVQHPAERFLKQRRVETWMFLTLCLENILSIFAQQSLICKGRELMACTSLEKSDGVTKTLGLARVNDRLVEIVLAVAEQNKTRYELGLLWQCKMTQHQEDWWTLILEGIPLWMQIPDLVGGFVHLDPVLNYHALCRQLRIHGQMIWEPDHLQGQSQYCKMHFNIVAIGYNIAIIIGSV